jgi:hypothetical protein
MTKKTQGKILDTEQETQKLDLCGESCSLHLCEFACGIQRERGKGDVITLVFCNVSRRLRLLKLSPIPHTTVWRHGCNIPRILDFYIQTNIRA